MVKVALLIGAYKNAGDFLISQRAKKLIEVAVPSVEIIEISRKEIVQKLELINSCDHIIFSGGPIYLNDINRYLEVQDINALLDKPVMIIGGGWNGLNGFSQAPYKYAFKSKTKDFLLRVEKESGLSCRDIHTFRTLKKEQITNVVLTGCPAWYDERYVRSHTFKNANMEINTIAISDPALKGHSHLVKKVVEYLRKKYLHTKIIVVFHRGVDASTDLYKYLVENNIEIKDISNSSQGFSIYDRCDLHLGFRVHAHIYNLSIRNRSILIEEDGRGAGVNQTLGLIPIKAYSDKINSTNKIIHRGIQKLGLGDNPYLLQEIDDYLAYLEQTDYCQIENAFSIMMKCYKNMIEFIKQSIVEEL